MIVVGAGLAGLSAANQIVKAGHSVLVVEARSRVGGRTLNEPVPGSVVEHGGQFLFSVTGENQLVALANEIGVKIWTPDFPGNSLYYRRGQRYVYDKRGPLARFPPSEAASLPDFLKALTQINSMASEVSSASPWTAPHAEDWDSQTFGSWVQANMATPSSRMLMSKIVETLMGAEPRDVSLLYLVSLVAGTGMTLQDIINKGVGSSRFIGGSHLISVGIAKRLGDAIVLASPVHRITQSGGTVQAASDDATFTGKQAIVALAPSLTAYIDYEPPLPPTRAQLVQRFPQGTAIKTHTVYDEPFWYTDEGLSGESIGDLDPVRVTYDVSQPGHKPALMEAFITGETARRWSGRPAGERQAAVVDCLVKLFGPKAGKPRQYLEHVWSAERWTRGCFYGFTPPGVLLDYGPAIREPVGRIHWAGTETATRWSASMDGAVRSGLDAARAALEAL